jgi:hypothetical protein
MLVRLRDMLSNDEVRIALVILPLFALDRIVSIGTTIAFFRWWMSRSASGDVSP